MTLKTTRDPTLPSVPPEEEKDDFERITRYRKGELTTLKELQESVYDDLVDHHELHESGGSGEISIADLAGLATDDQHVLDTEVLAVIASCLPWDIDVNPLMPANMTNWSNLVVNSLAVNNAIKQSSGDQNALIYWQIPIHAGTWTFYGCFYTSNVSGIVSVQIDDVEVGTIDLYSVSPVWNYLGQVASIIIATTGLHKLTLKMATKGSGSSYYGTIMSIKLLRVT